MSAVLQIDRMSLSDKLQAMEELWDDLCRRDAVPVPQWQKKLLDERQRLITQSKAHFTDWETAKKRIAKKCREH